MSQKLLICVCCVSVWTHVFGWACTCEVLFQTSLWRVSLDSMRYLFFIFFSQSYHSWWLFISHGLPSRGEDSIFRVGRTRLHLVPFFVRKFRFCFYSRFLSFMKHLIPWNYLGYMPSPNVGNGEWICPRQRMGNRDAFLPSEGCGFTASLFISQTYLFLFCSVPYFLY